jgi:hypothetical protein
MGLLFADDFRAGQPSRLAEPIARVRLLATSRDGMISPAPDPGGAVIRGSTLWTKISRHDLGI